MCIIALLLVILDSERSDAGERLVKLSDDNRIDLRGSRIALM